jgi:large subunit ribosomal protein L3
MSLGLVGRKCGMTRVFTEAGDSIPVTVIEVQANRVAQIKTNDTDGYNALQIACGEKKSSHVNKALAGHFAKAGVEAAHTLMEFRLDDSTDMSEYKLTDMLNVNMFTVGQTVDIRAVSKGKGFAGTVKRHNFKMQDATHGNSLSHRAPGSIGQCQTPGRVLKGKKMAGHMGDANVTVKNQQVIRVDESKNIILVKGTIPGAPGGQVVIKTSLKNKGAK